MSVAKFEKWQNLDGVTRNAVLQVVAQENRGEANTYARTTSSTYADMLNMSATITPTSATSKIMIFSVGGGLFKGSGTNASFRLLANDSVVWRNDRWGYTNDTAWSSICWTSTSMHFPSTTTAVTYKFQFAVSSGTSPEARIGDLANSYTAVFLMEIAQ